jgi:hypothetical protein
MATESVPTRPSLNTSDGELVAEGCRWSQCALYRPGFQVYCSEPCRTAATKELQASYRAKHRQPPPEPIPCEVCGIDTKRGFCQKHSRRCRVCGEQGKTYCVQKDGRTLGPYCRKHFLKRGGRPAGTPTSKVSDDEIIAALYASKSIREAAERCGVPLEGLRTRLKPGHRLRNRLRAHYRCETCSGARRGFYWKYCSDECARIAKASMGSRLGYIYVVRTEGAPYVKIGFTQDVRKRRIAQLQAANPLRLILERWIPGSEADECALHQRFAADRVRGEWFNAAILDRLES